MVHRALKSNYNYFNLNLNTFQLSIFIDDVETVNNIYTSKISGLCSGGPLNTVWSIGGVHACNFCKLDAAYKFGHRPCLIALLLATKRNIIEISFPGERNGVLKYTVASVLLEMVQVSRLSLSLSLSDDEVILNVLGRQ